MTKIDLHTHSSASDGTLSPRSLVKLAAESGLTAIGLTDHDTVDGMDEALQAGREFGVEIIPGIEFSVNWEEGSMHLLGYYIDQYHISLTEALHTCKLSRENRNEKIIARLNELGYSIKLEDVLKLSPDGTCGRAHIANALIRSGYFKSVKEAFDKLLDYRAAAYIDRYRLQLEEAIQIIHDAGGVAVWAHPGNHYKINRMLELLPTWVDFGLDGLESDYSDHSINLRDDLRKQALQHGLIYTGGSDFHGLNKPENSLGRGPEGSEIDVNCLRMLKERREVRRNS